MKTVEYNLRGKGQGASGKGNTRSLAPRPSPLAPAFTLTEILIVIGLIVLLLALALPAFNFITGGRSVDAAQNNIAAFLARARTEAIGLQETRGLMFFIDPKTPDRVSVAIVHETPAKATDNTNIDVFVDLTVDSEFLQLPKNVGVQLVDDCAYSGSPPTRADDGYIGFNDRNALGGTSPNGIRYGGIILFDGNGILTSKAYGFRATEANSSGTQVYTRMGELLFQNAKQGSNANPGDKDVIPTL